MRQAATCWRSRAASTEEVTVRAGPGLVMRKRDDTAAGRSRMGIRAARQRMLVPGSYRCSSQFPANHISVVIRTAEKARFRAVLRVGLGVRIPERYGNSLSERRILSEAWGLADLVYKLFSQQIQQFRVRARGVSRDWGDRDGIDITDRALDGWGSVDGSGFCRGPASLMWFPAVAGHCGNGVPPPISGQSPFSDVQLQIVGWVVLTAPRPAASRQT